MEDNKLEKIKYQTTEIPEDLVTDKINDVKPKVAPIQSTSRMLDANKKINTLALAKERMAQATPVKTELKVSSTKLSEYQKYYNKILNKKDESLESIYDAMFDFCYHFNIFYDSVLLRKIVNNKIEDTKLPISYLEALSQNSKYDNRTFLSQLKRTNFEHVYSEDLKLLTFSEEDLKNRQQVMNILGYDPFKNENQEDRPQLYRDLTGMLTENLRKDIAKQKSAIEIVKNYLTLSKYQKKITENLGEGLTKKNQKEIDSMIAMTQKLQSIINSTSKENGFSSNKALGKGGRGVLSEVMNQVETQYYDPGITNFYDQATSKSIAEISNISFKAQLAQVKLAGTDYADILTQQAIIVHKAQETARNALEALRICKSKITKDKLLDELEQEYRRKGISEDDIEQFISREYDMWDGQ